MIAAAPPPPPPPIVMAPPPVPVVEAPDAEGSPSLLEWTPGVVRCGDRFVAPVRLERPRLRAHWLATRRRVPGIEAIALTFRIDPAGRPLGIARVREAVGASLLPSGDLEPALAASSFAAGPERRECRIEYSASFIPFDKAGPAQLAEAAVDTFLWEEAARRIAPPDATCQASPLLPRVIHFPPLDEMPSPPGRLASIVYRYDIGADGAPTAIALVHNEGDAALAEATRSALAQSRFAPKPRTGCVSGTLQRPRPMPAPPPLAPTAFRAKDARCPVNATSILHVTDIPFPEPFRQRNIEGWALVRFDVAPWGEVGNAVAVAAEPASGFGDQARAVVLAARAEKSPTGYSGCVARVAFKLDDDAPAGTSIRGGTRR